MVITPKTATIIEFVRALNTKTPNRTTEIHDQMCTSQNYMHVAHYHRRFVTFPTHESFVFVSILLVGLRFFYFFFLSVASILHSVIETNM